MRRRLEEDFGGDAALLAEELERLPDEVGSRQDPERLQAAVVLAARGSVDTFVAVLDLARRDGATCSSAEASRTPTTPRCSTASSAHSPRSPRRARGSTGRETGPVTG
ncbi:hypothetical protein [Phycicoccus flavus]|uniref:Uncharacterized protein n=1 Tax=Phycicoccus flavus TaxID=2502783 RepID=A0A8T6R8V1_9MICO|nr:hypothetical protein [Phycicoccus flavus]NHA68631.1 hypothetical protein [Phycicoccus flavus]